MFTAHVGVCVWVPVYVCMFAFVCVRVHVRNPGKAATREWHSASASPDADVRAQLAHHFEVARDAAEPLRTLGVHVPMSQVPAVRKIMRLRWYDAAIKLVWDNWCNEEGGTLPDKPPYGATAWLFGMPGVGKTVWRNFMAIHILRNDDGTGVIVFDRGTGCERDAVLVRQVRGYDGSLHVQVATTDNQQFVKSAAAAAKRVFHLLDCSSGHILGHGLGPFPQKYFTVVSSLHDDTLLKLAKSRHATMSWSGLNLGALTLFAPPSTLDELLRVERSHGESGLSDDAVVAIVEKYGPIPRRLADCRTARRQQEFDRRIARNAEALCAHQQFTIPSGQDIIERVSDSIVVRRTTFNRKCATEFGRFELAGMEWASNYVRHLVADAIYRRAKDTQWGFLLGMREELAEELLLRLLAAGHGQQEHIKVMGLQRRHPKGLAALRDGITACAVLWMRTGHEEETLAKALRHVTRTGRPVLIRPFAHSYPGVNGLLVVAAGKQAKKDIVLLAMQSTVAASHALSAQGAVRMALWAELSTRHGITFDSLVYLLPRSRYAGWAPQDGVPAGLVQLAWAL